MKVDLKENGGTAFVRVEGDVDLYSSPKLRDAVLASVKKQLSPIVVNLSQVRYIDSSGVATLVEGYQLSREYGGSICLVGLNERISEVFKLARLHRVFKICQTEAEALETQPES